MKVVSVCHYLQGPAAVQYLADMGADVIKIEPLSGAFERGWSGANTFVGGVSGLFLCANRNQRSLALDLKTESGRRVFFRLIASADVFVENFRPGVLERLGVGQEVLKQHNPDLIFASATGFGRSGPLADKPGQDLLVQARTGLMRAAGGTTQPLAAGCAVMDQHGASLLAMGILGAYVKKLTKGVGTRVDASLFNAGIDLQMEALTNYLSAGFGPERFDRDSRLGSWFHQAPYGVYDLVDRVIAISNVDAATFANALDSDELRALNGIDRYAQRDQYAQTTAEVLRTRYYADVSRAFDSAGIWYAPVQDYGELATDPQALHNQVFCKVDVNGEIATLVNHPLRYDGAVPAVRHLSLELGEDSRAVMAELGYSAEEIEALVEQGVIGEPRGRAAAALADA